MKSKGRSGLDLMSSNLKKKKKEGKDSGVGRMALFLGRRAGVTNEKEREGNVRQLSLGSATL